LPNPFRAGRLRCILRIPVGIALALVLAELVVRQTYWCPLVQDPAFGAIVEPGATVRWTTEGDARSRWTERGIRRESLPPLGSRPILAVGDSFTEGLMVDDDVIYTTRLERALGGERPEVLMLSAGHAGASLADYVALAPDYRHAEPRRRSGPGPRHRALRVRSRGSDPHGAEQTRSSALHSALPDLAVIHLFGSPPAARCTRRATSISPCVLSRYESASTSAG